MAEFLEAVTRIAAALVALGAAVGVLAHPKSPVRWLYRRVFGDPFGAWVKAQVTEAIRPDVDRLDGRLDELTKRNDEQHRVNATQLAQLWTAVTTRNPDLRSDDEQEESP